MNAGTPAFMLWALRKGCYCVLRLSFAGNLRREQLPYLPFGKGLERTLRMFPDKLPIGIDTIGHDQVLMYLVTRPGPGHFRAFLIRHLACGRCSTSGPCGCSFRDRLQKHDNAKRRKIPTRMPNVTIRCRLRRKCQNPQKW
jgi:hypothetical protein